MKICICSKHNATTIQTHYLFNPSDVLIFVEPTEVNQYKILYPDYTIISVVKENQTIAYYKNFILSYIADDYCIIATDNITGFYMRNDKHTYDKLYKTDTLLRVLQNQLHKQCVYTIIPLELYPTIQTVNKQLLTKRGVLNVKEPTTFYGVNRKKLIEQKILFDTSQSAEDVDFAIQLIAHDENICFDYLYACSIDFKKLTRTKQKQLEYMQARQLRQKYGISFITLNYNDANDFISYKVMYSEIPSIQNMNVTSQHKKIKIEEVDETELKKVLLAVWVLDSTIAKPTLDDALDFSRKQTFAEAKKYIIQRLKKENLMSVLTDIEIPLLPILESMKSLGVKLDTAYLSELSIEHTLQLETISQRILECAGEKFNINSSQQLSHLLFDTLHISSANCEKTEKGAVSVKESELKKLLPEHPIIADILAYRELKKLLTTYIDALPKLVDSNNCIHATFLQTGTTTGRMSSLNPNLQNIPVKSEHGKKIRKAFVAREGYSFVAFDYSQIELRVAAILSNDTKMIDIFKHDKDIHNAVASEIFNVPATEVTSNMRRKAKIVNFGIIYGMSVKALHANMKDAADETDDNVTLEDAQKFYNKYFDNFSELAEYIETAKREVAQIGYTKTLFGRIRYFKTLQTATLQAKATLERMLVNTPIQGTSADIIKIAMIRISEYIAQHKLTSELRMLLQIHDELIFEVKTTLSNKHLVAIKTIMESIITKEVSKGITLKVNAKKGSDWSSLQEITI